MEDETDSSKPQPNGWYQRQLWREPFPADRTRAAQVRRTLASLCLYPRRDLAQNSNLGVMEANHRAALPEIMAELDRSDLAALLYVARLLATVPREADWFEQGS
ncbi:MAG: hypothetical protein BroJett011_19050 [Chloroflexota bacterium]|nr:MAG: hypothetical protein BroJett011_19050 [Chloroflexota bacterium]